MGIVTISKYVFKDQENNNSCLGKIKIYIVSQTLIKTLLLPHPHIYPL